jgi:hypothetical protein
MSTLRLPSVRVRQPKSTATPLPARGLSSRHAQPAATAVRSVVQCAAGRGGGQGGEGSGDARRVARVARVRRAFCFA